ncbi:hypothetical protein RCL_jg29394.t1 [Rhizophagus clarus]|uniref:Protein kinase domain-containing protein n=1 Tax=Rhizophagus clarus TaxID=94130 RepID=A0A8H3L2V7_9GLOM|nr:hypothetical protein RCL_jg29394.t1 [Rhizophagus clarus]
MSTSTIIDPLVEDVKKYDTEGLITYLRGKNLGLKQEVYDILQSEDVNGHSFLRLTEERLNEYNIKGRSRMSLVDLINNLNSQKQFVADNDTLKWQKRLKVYHDTVSRGLEANSPSVEASPDIFFKNQQTNPILNGRPLENIGPPITLYNSAFSLFLNHLNDENLEIPSDFLKWAEKLIFAAADNYDNGEECNEIMRKIFMENLGSIFLIAYEKKNQKYKSDEVFITSSGLLVVGIGKNDPTIQGAIYYRNYWSQQNVEQIRDCCCVPSFIITMTGPWLCILGGIFLSRVVIQPLTDLIPLTVNLRDFDKVKRIARLFYSLFLAFRQLNLFYQKLKLTASDQRFFPYVQQFKFNGDNVNFTYINELSDDYKKTIWKAKKDNGQMIVVKFTPEYNVEAHNLCADVGCAPNLLYCSDDVQTQILGGFRMIIMEYVNGISLDQKLAEGELAAESCKTIYKDMERAIKLLHGKNFVFADLRASNVLVFETEDTQRAMLIDFDWCGKDDVDRYPPSMNQDLSWPSEAKPCALLKKNHDLYWLDLLLHEYLSPPDTFTFKLPDPSSVGSRMSSGSRSHLSP